VAACQHWPWMTAVAARLLMTATTKLRYGPFRRAHQQHSPQTQWHDPAICCCNRHRGTSSACIDQSIGHTCTVGEGAQDQTEVAAPTTSDASTDTAVERAYERRDASGAPRPLAPALVTLSMLPRPQWQTLAHLDAIQARSRPQQPVQKPEAAPFFLPTVAGVTGRSCPPLQHPSATPLGDFYHIQPKLAVSYPDTEWSLDKQCDPHARCVPAARDERWPVG